MEEKKDSAGESRKDNFLTSVWNFFTSIKLTVFLLIILALVSIIGTVVDQTDPAKNLGMLEGMFGKEDAPGVLELLVDTGMTNMYHSWWFVLLLTLLSTNITICTLDRLPGVFKIMSRVQGPLTDDTLKGLGFKKEIKVKGGMDSVKDKARAAMKASGFYQNEAEDGGAFHLYSDKGKYSRLGVYITHLSVLIIFAGALIGSFWGFKGYAQILENSSVTSVGLINKPLLRGDLGDEMPLGFRVRCDKFELVKYETFGGMPSNYLSDLTVIDGEKEVMKKQIRVNDPLQYKGIRFYQSSYGVVPEMATMTIRVTATGAGLNVKDYSIKSNEKVHIEGSDYDMVITQMAPDVAMGPGNQLVAQSDQFKGSAAAIMQFFDSHGHQVDQAVIMNMDPSSQPKNIPFSLSIMGYRGPFYTGLQVTYDPGVWVVWIGCILMVLGICVAFFTTHKRVWVRLKEGEKGSVVITAGGSANKNRYAFERDFDRLVERLGE
ncbi:MAG: cytochrome c biogenesis protein ResB [Nitrospirae bacterium]|nr:cytochrome c biogenesis protein ResB [Nitrospirota bacterium]